MQQKIIYKHFLLIGISIFFLFTGCGKEDVEYRMTMDLLYVNQTDKVISFIIRPDISSNDVENVTILPQTQSKVFSYDVEGVDKNINPDNCCQDILIDVYGGRGLEGESQTLRIDDVLCVTHLNEKSVDLTNYSSEKVADRHFRYRYTFTDIDLENAEPCE